METNIILRRVQMSGTGVVVDVVRDVIGQFVSEDKVFSAFDITEEIRKSGDARHYDVKSIVHNLYLNGQLGNNTYNRQVIVLDCGDDDYDVWVYFPFTKSAYDHPLAKKQTIQVPVDTDEDTDEVTVTVTDEHRIQIPQKVLKQVTPDQITKAYDVACNGNVILRKPESDGRVRITEATFPVGARLNVTTKGNTIEISPK